MMNVLIIGKDTTGLLSEIKKALEFSEYKVKIVSDSIQSLDLFFKQKFDIAIIEQNFLLDDHTPFFLAIQYKFANDLKPYKPIMMIVHENFTNHNYYKEVDSFIPESISGASLIQKVEELIEAAKFFTYEKNIFIHDDLNTHRSYLDKELALKDRELASFALQLMKKNNQLNYLYNLIEQNAEKEISTTLSQLKSELKKIILEEIILDSFFTYFNKINPGFFEQLKLTGELTPNEKRLCAYIKIGMDNKEIANLFSVSLEGIKKAQTRIKKKIIFNDTVSLREYLIAL